VKQTAQTRISKQQFDVNATVFLGDGKTLISQKEHQNLEEKILYHKST